MTARCRLKEARKQSRDLTDRNRIERQSGSDERARIREVPYPLQTQVCRFGRCAVKAVKLTPGDLHRVRRD